MSIIARTLGVSRSTLTTRTTHAARRGRPPLPDDTLRAIIEDVIAKLPTYGYRRAWAMVCKEYGLRRLLAPNHKRIYRVMKHHRLLLQRGSGPALMNEPMKGRLSGSHSDERCHRTPSKVPATMVAVCASPFR